MGISLQKTTTIDQHIPALGIGLFEKNLSSQHLPVQLQSFIKKCLQKHDFKGKKGESLLLHTIGDKLPSQLLLIGLGEESSFDWNQFRNATSLLISQFLQAKINTFSFFLPGEQEWKDFDFTTALQTAGEAYTLTAYRFTHYQKKQTPKEKITVLTKNVSPQSNHDMQEGLILGEAVNLARDLVNHPSSYATPEKLAQTAKSLSRLAKVKCRILDKKEMEKLGMGGMLGVSQGSKQPPKFIILEYLPLKQQKPLVFVGKGITFDSGGINLKPPQSMEQMKYDMAGGAAVIGAMQAISRLKIKQNVIGIVPAAENMPDGGAYKPGDILKMYSGKTVEVLNTDAEGRLVLADALSYALRYQPSAIVDLATLTGASVVALGHHAIAMLGNHPPLLKAVHQSGEITGERVWELPLWDDYKDVLKSNIADLRNIGDRWAGAITGALFLSEFIEKAHWVHLDIAGTAWIEKEKPCFPKGASGIGVRLLTHLAQHWNA